MFIWNSSLSLIGLTDVPCSLYRSSGIHLWAQIVIAFSFVVVLVVRCCFGCCFRCSLLFSLFVVRCSLFVVRCERKNSLSCYTFFKRTKGGFKSVESCDTRQKGKTLCGMGVCARFCRGGLVSADQADKQVDGQNRSTDVCPTKLGVFGCPGVPLARLEGQLFVSLLPFCDPPPLAQSRFFLP